MTNTKTCKVKLLNKTYEIKCPEGEAANLSRAAKKLQEQVSINKSKFKTLDPYQILLLSALDVAHELVVTKNAQEQQRDQVSKFISSLESRINHMVSGDMDTIPHTD